MKDCYSEASYTRNIVLFTAMTLKIKLNYYT